MIPSLALLPTSPTGSGAATVGTWRRSRWRVGSRPRAGPASAGGLRRPAAAGSPAPAPASTVNSAAGRVQRIGGLQFVSLQIM